MYDIQHDSPVPVHEQIAGQIMAHVASGALKAGAELAEYRAFAQELLTNPKVVARAYADLEFDGVLTKSPGGGMEVTSDAAVICRIRQHHTARLLIRQAVRDARSGGLAEADIRKAVEQELASTPAPSPAPATIPDLLEKPPHATGHRDSQGIKVLSPQKGRGQAQPDRSSGSHIRPPRR
jgi:DNA-binding transcriptional regulator YhcF (GntR family)